MSEIPDSSLPARTKINAFHVNLANNIEYVQIRNSDLVQTEYSVVSSGSALLTIRFPTGPGIIDCSYF